MDCSTQQNSTSNVGLLDTILLPRGHRNENKARELYARKTGTTVGKAGLFISLEFGALGASPDGLIEDDGILEIKCPYVERNLLPTCVADRSKGKFIVRKDGEYTLVKTHHYYKQVIMQLHITERNFYDFVIWTQGAVTTDPLTQEGRAIVPEGHIHIIRILRNAETTKTWEKMRTKIAYFLPGGPSSINRGFTVLS